MKPKPKTKTQKPKRRKPKAETPVAGTPGVTASTISPTLRAVFEPCSYTRWQRIRAWLCEVRRALMTRPAAWYTQERHIGPDDPRWDGAFQVVSRSYLYRYPDK